MAALVCSLVGDVLLMLPTDRFVAGLAAFLVGHLLLRGRVLGARTRLASALSSPPSWWCCAWCRWPARILRALRHRRQLAVPVALYMGVISVMVATALATGNVLAGVGAVLFVTSDAMIAWNRFVRPFRAAELGIMVTYHLGQAGLVLSLLH